MYEKLLVEADRFLQEHLAYNEIELSDGNLKVRLVRFTPVPMVYPLTYWPSGWPWQPVP